MNDDVKKIDIEPWSNLQSVVYLLMAYRANGDHVYCEYNGHKLYSDNISMEAAYIEITGKTKEEYEKEKQELYDQFEDEYKKQKVLEQHYKEKVLESQNEIPVSITQEKVVEGLKFIAENREIEQDKLNEALINLGCNFSLEDIKNELKKEDNYNKSLFDGMTDADPYAGATVICNTRDSDFGRIYVNDRFLDYDSDSSIYHYIRKATGDENYTKENIENGTLNKGRSM